MCNSFATSPGDPDEGRDLSQFGFWLTSSAELGQGECQSFSGLVLGERIVRSLAVFSPAFLS